VFHSVESLIFPFETKTKNNVTGKQEAGVMEIAVAEQELSTSKIHHIFLFNLINYTPKLAPLDFFRV
jgi:hypothetical protein